MSGRGTERRKGGVVWGWDGRGPAHVRLATATSEER